MMITLTQKSLHFNRSIKLSTDGGALSSDTGKLIFREFEKMIFSQTFAKDFQLKDQRSLCIQENNQLLRQRIYQLITDYNEDDPADKLTKDPVFIQVSDEPTLPSQRLITLFQRFNAQALDQLQVANQELVDKLHHLRQTEALLIDLDFPIRIGGIEKLAILKIYCN